MEGYKVKTDGAYIEMRETSIIFNYKNCDIDLGKI